jgi:hypothetical protein
VLVLDSESLSGEECITSRNSIVAATILQGADLYRHTFAEFLQSLFKSQANNIDWVRFIKTVVRQYSQWSPIFQYAQPAIKRNIRTRIRGELHNHETWLNKARQTVNKKQDWGTAVSWSSAMYHLLPKSRDLRNKSTVFLINENRRWCELFAKHCPPDKKPLATYLVGKSNLLTAEMDGTTSEVRPAVLRKWKTVFDVNLLGVDFYCDVARQARDEAGAEINYDTRAKWVGLAADAFERVLAYGPEDRTDFEIEYSDLLTVWMRVLPTDRQLEIVRGV